MPSKPSTLSVTDLFCGAGGSSIGAEAAGLKLALGINHWQQAIDTHASNFPQADHDCRDVSNVHPARYRSTHVLIASPECTMWTQARGKARNFSGQQALDPGYEPLPSEAEERSRATMWDVVRFAEYHQYEAIVVENVVDIWPWALLPVWFQAMEKLGYAHRALFLNCMFFDAVPQSRDRVFIVFWRRGNRSPQLDFTPRAWCWGCQRQVLAVQAWKRPDRQWGRFRQQYIYACPICAQETAPFVWPASIAIDWDLPGQRIGDRKRPLAAATMARIQAGIEKYWLHPIVFDMLRDAKHRPTTLPLVTQTSRQSLALLTHFRGTDPRQALTATRPVNRVMGGITGGGTHHGLVEPEPLYVKNFGAAAAAGPMAHPVSEPLGSVTTVDHHALLRPPRDRSRSGLITPINGGRHGDGGHNETGLITPAGGTWRRDATSTEEPLPTRTSTENDGLATPPDAFLSSYYGNETDAHVGEPMGALTTRDRHALIEGPVIAIEDCFFRMLAPPEIGRGQAFPVAYRVLGNQREQVQQYGQAVPPPPMHWILSRIVESLA